MKESNQGMQQRREECSIEGIRRKAINEGMQLRAMKERKTEQIKQLTNEKLNDERIK